MKKIDKSKILATQYHTWLKKLKKEDEIHYDTSKYRTAHYLDVLLNLIIIQDGLCAYTEFRLVDQDKIPQLKAAFVAGKYTSTKPESSFEIEHFNSALKSIKGWEWSNLFAVYDSINTKVKRIQESKLGINNILKPDTKQYDPNKYLDYDIDLHIFFPAEHISKAEQKNVIDMIQVLGLNWGQIKMKREEFIKQQIFKREHNTPTNIHQFITAYNMYISKI
jgi:hypothetical protein